MARIYYVHWDKDETLDTVRALRESGHRVRYEYESGREAWNVLKTSPPDALVISLSRLPSHGRRVAAVTAEYKKLRELPVVFVGGEGDKTQIARAEFPNALFCSASTLKSTLSKIL